MENEGKRRFAPNGILDSDECLHAFAILQATGSIEGNLSLLSWDARAYLVAEASVRNSVYRISEADLTCVSSWMKTLIGCMGHLFTSPLLALKDLDTLELKPMDPVVELRLRTWRMHLLLLVGRQKEGVALRSQIEKILEGAVTPWKAEHLTILALSYYSTAQSEASVELHRRALEYTRIHPEIYFRTFGASMAERAALKAGDPVAFQYFSNVLDECLRLRPDDRYELRQHGYRAMVFTQLGELGTAERHWASGDALLTKVDLGLPSVERIQYLMFRALAAVLLGEPEDAKAFCEQAKAELSEVVSFDVHTAELNICFELVRVGDPKWRSTHLAEAKDQIIRAHKAFEERLRLEVDDAVRERYREGMRFCDILLHGPASGLDTIRALGTDKWQTLTLTILDMCQNTQSFASKLNYFRLIPAFLTSVESHGLSDAGIHGALEEVLGFPLAVSERNFMNASEELGLGPSSEIGGLLRFADKLRSLARKADESARAEAIMETTQIIAHDIRRPFRLFSSALRVFEAKLPEAFFADEVLTGALKCLKTSERKVNGLLSDLLVADRPVGLNLEPCLLEDLIAGCVNEIDSSSNVEVEYHLDLKRLRTRPVDRLKFERALLNVLENARDHTECGGIINISAFEPRSGHLVISVKNPSIIDPTVLPLIFDRFFTMGKPSGTGLGLFITKKIVEAHDGLVTCVSDAQDGTIFTIELPPANNDTSREPWNFGTAPLERGSSKFGLLLNSERLETTV